MNDLASLLSEPVMRLGATTITLGHALAGALALFAALLVGLIVALWRASSARALAAAEAAEHAREAEARIDGIMQAQAAAKLLGPAFYEPVGVDVVTALPTEPVVTQFRMDGWDVPFPPETNQPPDKDNNVHHDMNFLPSAQAQIGAALLQGKIIQPCSGTCDPG